MLLSKSDLLSVEPSYYWDCWPSSSGYNTWVGIPPEYVTSQLGQLSLASLQSC